jgi:hypothetical protein
MSYELITIGSVARWGGFLSMPPGPAYQWPVTEPDTSRDYALNYSIALQPLDVPLEASLSVQPSGSGELQATNLRVVGGLLTWHGAGGIAGRNYIVKINIRTALPETLSFLIGLPIDDLLAIQPLPDPPNSGFGPIIEWMLSPPRVPSQNYTAAENSSVFYFDGMLSGYPFTAFPPQPLVPSQDYTAAENSSVFYYDGELAGYPFAVFPASAIVPSLNFSDARNSGLRVFRGQPSGIFYAPSPSAPVPSQNYTTAANSSVFYYDGELAGFAFAPSP